MKEKIKNMKGITLVALIITIIVLLILAVVAITSINNNKIIEYAKNGRDSYNQKATDEKEKINSYEQYIKDSISNSGGGTTGERTFYGLSDVDFLMVLKFKSNNKVDILNYDFENGSNGEEVSTEYSGRDIWSYTISDGKYYIIMKDEDTGEDIQEEFTITKVGDYNLLIFSDLHFIEGQPPIVEDLIGKNYTLTSNGASNGETYTIKKYTANGVSFMNFYRTGSNVEEGHESNYIVIIGNTVYEMYKGGFFEFGTINLDKTSSAYGTITQTETDDKDGKEYIYTYTPSN